jgi:hypothetical protein
MEPITAILSFFGGSTFRMVWGEVSSFFTLRAEHKREIERMRVQGELEAAQHLRNLEAIKVQADLQVQVIRVQGDADIDKLEGEGWLEAVKSTGRAVGITWVDAWNAVIRPGVATWAILMLSANEFEVIEISPETASVAFAALGIYLADRTLAKRSK